MKNTTHITVRLPNGSNKTFIGREAWALRLLLNAGSAGVTTLEQPAPRWSHYLFKLRKSGLLITTDYESHGGPYPGAHGRYRLHTPLTVVGDAA